MQTLDQHGDVFAALADPNRRAVLALLAAMGEGTATSIAARMPISRQAVVKHLAQLDRARLVQRRRAGREARYTLRAGQLAATAHELAAIAARWDRTLEALKEIAESDEAGGDASGNSLAAGN